MVKWKQVSLFVLGWGAGVVGVVLTLIWVPKVEVYGLSQVRHPEMISRGFYKRDVFTQEDRARQTLATILGGLAVLAGAGLTLRNVRAAEKSAEIARVNAETASKVAEQNAEAARRTIKISEDKQLTDRFTAAVTNLSADGPEKMAQRLGGIYALERIARDSPADHWTVMEVLTAYIRDKRANMEDKKGAYTTNLEQPHKDRTLVPTDIQAILTVIGRRIADQDSGEELDLYKTNLFKANLRGANLRGATLFRAILMKAYLKAANLEMADLREADLQEADLREAKLKQSKLLRANLAFAQLAKAELQEAILERGNFEAADLAGSDLTGANLKMAQLAGARLGGAKMADCLNLTQDQLDLADQRKAPASLPHGLTFPGYAAPEPTTAPPA